MPTLPGLLLSHLSLPPSMAAVGRWVRWPRFLPRDSRACHPARSGDVVSWPPCTAATTALDPLPWHPAALVPLPPAGPGNGQGCEFACTPAPGLGSGTRAVGLTRGHGAREGPAWLQVAPRDRSVFTYPPARPPSYQAVPGVGGDLLPGLACRRRGSPPHRPRRPAVAGGGSSASRPVPDGWVPLFPGGTLPGTVLIRRNVLRTPLYLTNSPGRVL